MASSTASDVPVLTIVGTGVGGRHRMTGEVAGVIRGAREIVHLTTFTSAEWAELSGAWRVRSLAGLYGLGDLAQTYRVMADEAVAAAGAAHAAGGYGCFAMYGHPLWFVNTARVLVDSAEQVGVRVKVYPGLSSLDVLLLDSPIDLGSGVVVLDAFQFVRDGLEPEPRVPLVLMHFGELAARRPALAALSGALTNRYGADHRVCVVRAPRAGGDLALVENTTTNNLVDLRERLDDLKGSTLVVSASVSYRDPLS